MVRVMVSIEAIVTPARKFYREGHKGNTLWPSVLLSLW